MLNGVQQHPEASSTTPPIHSLTNVPGRSAKRMKEIAVSRFPEQYAAQAAQVALLARVHVITPDSGTDLLQKLQVGVDTSQLLWLLNLPCWSDQLTRADCRVHIALSTLRLLRAARQRATTSGQ